jgi:hypothetical protein
VDQGGQRVVNFSDRHILETGGSSDILFDLRYGETVGLNCVGLSGKLTNGRAITLTKKNCRIQWQKGRFVPVLSWPAGKGSGI